MGVIYQLRHTNIGQTAALLYQVLRELSCGEGSKRRGYVYASRDTLAGYCRCSERTIRRAIRELEEAGLIRDERMGRGLNNRIYVASSGSGTPVQSRPDKNAHSHYNSKETNSSDISIHPQTMSNAPEARTDRQSAEDARTPVQGPREAAKLPLTVQPRKGKPTPRRPRNDRKERRQAARARYAEALRARLFQGKSGQTLAMLDDDGSRWAAAEAAIDMLSDGLAAGRNIKVGGAYLTPEQYWRMVQHIDLSALEDVLERVERAEGVRNLQGYLYASLYNECAYRQLRQAVV